MVYIEKIIIIDFLIHYFTFYLTSYLYAIHCSKIRLLLGEIINIALIFIYIYVTRSLIFMLIGALIVAFVSFGGRKKILCVGEVFLYAALNTSFAGVSEVIYLSGRLSSFVLMGLLLAFFIIVVVFGIHTKLFARNKQLLYELVIEDNGKKYAIKGYLDTGNFMESDSLPVIILSNKYVIGRLIKKDWCYTVGGKSQLELYQVDKILIKIDKKYREIGAYIGYSNITFDAMFGLRVIRNA